MMLCDASRPGIDAGLYHQPYAEAVEGYDHAYATKHDGVVWTRRTTHPEDRRCPGCAPTGIPDRGRGIQGAGVRQ